MNLDEIDREIVRLLQADASLTARELAEHVGLTATPVWRRVQILESAGVITGRVALVDPEALGLGGAARLVNTPSSGAEIASEGRVAIGAGADHGDVRRHADQDAR